MGVTVEFLVENVFGDGGERDREEEQESGVLTGDEVGLK